MYSWLIYGNFWIAIGAVGMTYSTSIMLSDKVDVRVLFIVFFATLIGYNYQRFMSVIYFENDNEKDKWFLLNLPIIKIISLLSFLVCLVIFFYTFNYKEGLYFLPFLFIIICYRWPVLGKALRDIPYIKIFLIAITWGAITVLLPQLSTDKIDSINWLFIINNSLYIIGITIPFDIRDLNYDLNSQKTLPQIFGIKTAVFIAITMLIITGLFYVYIGFIGLFIHCILSIIVVLLALKKRPDWYYLFILDGLLVLFPFFTFI